MGKWGCVLNWRRGREQRERETMRKEITVPQTKYVTLCDLCGKDASNGFSDTCWICRKEVCLNCRALLFAGHDNDVIEMPIKVCKTCQKVGSEYRAGIDSALVMANREVRMQLDTWKQLVNETKE